jgi:hypothetical protein
MNQHEIYGCEHSLTILKSQQLQTNCVIFKTNQKLNYFHRLNICFLSSTLIAHKITLQIAAFVDLCFTRLKHRR